MLFEPYPVWAPLAFFFLHLPALPSISGGERHVQGLPAAQRDGAATLDVLRLLDDLRSSGQTLLIVTHDSRIAATADRLISMRDGAFVEETRLTHGTTGRLAELAGLEG